MSARCCAGRGCRCKACRAAEAARKRAYRERIRIEPEDGSPCPWCLELVSGKGQINHEQMHVRERV